MKGMKICLKIWPIISGKWHNRIVIGLVKCDFNPVKSPGVGGTSKGNVIVT